MCTFLALELPCLKIDVDLTQPPLVSRSPSVRVSTPLRRGAAPYGDGSWRLVEARTLGSLLSFEVQSRTEGGIYVTFCVRQDSIKSSVQFGQGIPQYTYPPF